MDWQVGMRTLRTVRGAKYVLCQRGKAIGGMWDRPWYSSYLRCKGVRHQLLSGYFTSSQFRQLEFTLYPIDVATRPLEPHAPHVQPHV